MGPLGSVTPARGWQPGVGGGVSQREKGVHTWVGQGHPEASSLPFKEPTARISAIRGASCEKQPLFNNINSLLNHMKHKGHNTNGPTSLIPDHSMTFTICRAPGLLRL